MNIRILMPGQTLKIHNFIFSLIIVSIFCFLTPQKIKADLIINEIMQSNLTCIMDDLNEYPDSWVELYNDGETTINLKDYKIGIKTKDSKAYPLPSHFVQPKQFVIIYCDKEGKGLHTDFRLESGKNGAVYLFKDGNITASLENIAKMPAPDISYGRLNENSDVWGYQITPTPGDYNCGKLSDVILPEPIFSIKGRVLFSPVSLNITLPQGSPENAKIFYTLDGSEPDDNSLIWESELTIDKSTVVRAKLMANDAIAIPSTTHSYIFHGQNMTIPIISIVGNKEDFYSDEKGILSDFEGKLGNPNFIYDWRRPINFEYFSQDENNAELNQICETRLKGHKSRYNLIKSMVVYANKRFGTNRLEYEFFPDQKEGLSDFKSIELRNAGNDCNYLYMRDAVIQRIMGENADIDWSACQPAVVYINGEYLGILNIRERANEDFIYTNYDGLETVDIIENWTVAEEGTFDEFAKFRDFYSQGGHSLEDFAKFMDIEEFINYFVMNVYYSNIDWPGNNSIIWRSQDAKGKWRWIAKDCDLGLGLYRSDPEYPVFDFLYYPEIYTEYGWVNEEQYTRLIRNLFEIPEFKELCIDYFTIYMGDFLTPANTAKIVDLMAETIAEEYPRHMEKNVDDQYKGIYTPHIAILKQWVEDRHRFMYSHLQKFFNLENFVPLTIDFESVGNLFFNDIKVVNPTIWDGKYRVNKNFNLTTDSGDFEYVISLITPSGENTYKGKDSVLSFTLPKDCLSARIKLINPEEPGNIDSVTFNPRTNYMIFDLQGKNLGKNIDTLKKGIYLIRQEGNTFKFIKP